MKNILIFCKSPHVAGSIGEICRDIAGGLVDAGNYVVFASSCEPLSYIEKNDLGYYPVDIGESSLKCFCNTENIIVHLYEMILNGKFDTIISVGERAEIDIVSAAVQVAGVNVEHFHFWTGSAEPSPSLSESLLRLNGVFCFGNVAGSTMGKMHGNVIFLDVKRDCSHLSSHHDKKSGIIIGGPCNDTSSLLSVIEGLKNIQEDVFAFSNIYEPSDYDMKLFADYCGVTVDFGNDAYGTFYGLDNDNLYRLASSRSAIVDLSMKQSCCYAVDTCIQCGCLPFLSRTPRHIDLLMTRGATSEIIDALTIPCVKFRPGGGDCVWISDFTKMQEKYEIMKDSKLINNINGVLLNGVSMLATLRKEICKFFKL